MKKLFKQIGKGWLRLHIVISALLILICFFSDDPEIELLIAGLILGGLYWILVIAVHWIIDGFRTQRKLIQSPENKDRKERLDKVVHTSVDSATRVAEQSITSEQIEGESIPLEKNNNDDRQKPLKEVGTNTQADDSKRHKLPKFLRVIINVMIYLSLFLSSYFIFFAVFLFSILAITGDKGFAGRQSPLLAMLIAFIFSGYLGRRIIKKLALRLNR